jgi:hypothetical protein
MAQQQKARLSEQRPPARDEADAPQPQGEGDLPFAEGMPTDAVAKRLGVSPAWLNVARRLQQLASPPQALPQGTHSGHAILKLVILADGDGQPVYWSIFPKIRLEPKGILLQSLVSMLSEEA